MSLKYIFFDTECASHSGGVSHICSFGYLICDRKYNILEKDDIIIDPKCAFDLESFEKSDFSLAYPEEYFRTFPDFSGAYERICRILTMPDSVLIGHSAACDAACISQSIDMYGLPRVDFTYLDTQKMHKHFGSNELVSLNKLCGIYSVPLLREHKSDDDAEMTAGVTRAICSANGVSLEALLKQKELIGVLYNGVVHDDLSAAFPIGDGCRMNNTARRLFKRYLSSRRLDVTPDPEFIGKRYCFDEYFENTRFCEMLYIVDILRGKGAEYTRNVPDCNIFVDFGINGGKSRRLFSAGHSRSCGRKGKSKKIISSGKLLLRLGITPEKLRSVSSPEDTDRIFGSTADSAEWFAYYNKCFK